MAEKRRRKKRIITLIVLAVLGALIAVGVIRISKARKELLKAQADRQIASAALEMRSIETTVVGNGTLSEGALVPLYMPKGISVKSVLVKEGDAVEAGQVLAVADHGSVRDAIAELQDAIGDIDEELLALEEKKEETEVLAPVSGHVEKVYVSRGEEAGEAMDKYGALLLIVTDGDRREVRITAISGEITEIPVNEGDQVKQGDVLLKLYAVRDETRRSQLLSEREDIDEVMAHLYALSRTDEIKAGTGGVVREVYIKEGEKVTNPVKPSGENAIDLASALTGGTSGADASMWGGLGLMAAGKTGQPEEDGHFGVLTDGETDGGFVLLHADLSADPDDDVLPAEEGGDIQPVSSETEDDQPEPQDASEAEEPLAGASEDTGGDGGEIIPYDAAVYEEEALDLNGSVESAEELPAEGAAEEEDAAAGGAGSLVFLQGSFFLPIRIPANGDFPMTLEEAQSFLSGVQYHLTQLSWSIGEGDLFAPGGSYTAHVVLETDTENNYYILPDSRLVNVSALGSTGAEYTIIDENGDGLYESLAADVHYEVANTGAADETDGDPSGSVPETGGSPLPGTIDLPDINMGDINLPDVNGGTITLPDVTAGTITLPDGTKIPGDISTDSIVWPEGLDLSGLLGGLAGQSGGADLSSLLGGAAGQTGSTDLSSLLGNLSGQSGNADLSSLLGNLSGQNGNAGLASLLGAGGANPLAALQGAGLNGADLSSLLAGQSAGIDLSQLGTQGLSSGSLITGSYGGLAGTYAGKAASFADAEAFSISTGETMDVTISVNEMDILSVEKGQKATLVLDALEGESFDGVVTEIAASGTNAGGVTKYDVTVSTKKEARMRPDMSCTVTISIAKEDHVPVLPAQAITTEQGKNYVYTERNEDGTLGGKVEVVTGMADGEYVEVKSGLSDGQVVYYRNKSVNLFDMRMDAMNEMYGQTESAG